MKYEANLEHQRNAVNDVLKVFNGVEFHNNNKGIFNNTNPELIDYENNIKKNIYKIQNNDERLFKSNFNKKVDNLILDVQMETGTGKTYTYLQTIIELYKEFNIQKFMIAVPGIAVLEGTKYFLNSEDTRNHFRTQYNIEYDIYLLESQGNKSKKERLNSNVQNYTDASIGRISILLTNEGMLNKLNQIDSSGKKPTLFREYDDSKDPELNSIAKCIEYVKPVMILDEAHKFSEKKNAYSNLLSLNPLFVIRYGATFKNTKNKEIYENHIHLLSSVDAFNLDLVKKINVIIPTYDKNGLVKNELKFVAGDSKKAKFISSTGESEYIIGQRIEGIDELSVKAIQKNKVILKYNNGQEVELTKNQSINKLLHNQKIIESTVKLTIKEHFEKASKLLNRENPIKPLTLFFIQTRGDYESIDGKEAIVKKYFLKYLEYYVSIHIKTATGNFKKYLELINKDFEKSHSGYFSGDKDKNEITKERADLILNNKEELLSLDNSVSFIFSQWTLKEGWDNPNVFQICKLRTSGSETSKLQEVGRGLRLPLDLNFNRIKDSNDLVLDEFRLNYFADISEQDFTNQLQKDVNSYFKEEIPTILTEEMEQKIAYVYPEFQNEKGLPNKLLIHNTLHENGIVDDMKNLIISDSGEPIGYNKLQTLYPLSKYKNKVDSGNINEVKIDENGNRLVHEKKLIIRPKHYEEFQKLWTEINKKLIFEYSLESEEKYADIVKKILSTYSFDVDVTFHKNSLNFKNNSINTQITNNRIIISDMTYSELLDKLSKNIKLKKETLHRAFIDLKKDNLFNINNFLNFKFIIEFSKIFREQLIVDTASMTSYSHIIYDQKIGETVFTDKDGNFKNEIEDSLISRFGDINEEIVPAYNYLFEKAFGDSDLENENITQYIENVVVFSKIPKNSVKIPIPGGFTYSPDFAYVVNFKNGSRQLNLVIETKNKTSIDLSSNENSRIDIASKLYSNQSDYDVIFKKQLSHETINNIISNL